MQRLIDQTPSGFYSHNTGGEHAPRVDGDELKINALRVRHGLDETDVSAYDYADTHDGYVMLHKLLPEGGSMSSLAGYVLAQRVDNGLGFSYTIDDLLVDKEMRNHGLGSFLVGKLATKGVWSNNGRQVFYPDGLIIETTLDDDTYSWLVSRGFKTAKNGLELLLPGHIIHAVPRVDAEELVDKMPDDWAGCIEFVPADENDDFQRQLWVYRGGRHRLQGVIKRNGRHQFIMYGDREIATYPHSIEPIGSPAFTGNYTDEFFAIVDLLNAQAN